MKILKRILIVFTLLILVIGGCIYYAFKIEPYRVTLNEFALNEEKPDREHLKIVQISDLHIKADFTYKNLDKVIKRSMNKIRILLFLRGICTITTRYIVMMKIS